MMTNFSSLQDFLLQEQTERNYFNLMSEEGSKHLIFQCVMSVLHVVFVIPTNIFTLIVIAKTKSLWTLSNTILAINGLFMAVGSTLMLFLRQSHFPLLLFDEKDRAAAYTIFWWVCCLTLRIGNCSYMLLAFIRYVAVCLDKSSWWQKKVDTKPNLQIICIFLSAIIIPSILWTSTMYFGSDATGKLWYFKPQINANESYSVIAFQAIQEHKRYKTSMAVVITTACLLSLQITITLYFCIKISLTSLKATIAIALKDNASEEYELKELGTRKANTAEVQRDVSCSSTMQRRNSVQLFANSVLNRMLERERKNKKDKNFETDNLDSNEICFTSDPNHQVSNCEERIKINTTEDIDEQVPKISIIEFKPDECNGAINGFKENPDAIFTISNEVIDLNDDDSKFTYLDISSNLDLDSSIGNEDILSHDNLDNSKTKKVLKRRKRKIFPKVNDYKPVVPIPGAKLVNIPLTSAVICVSRKDIICTTSLVLQVVCLIITYILSFNGFNISGKEVSLESYIWAVRFIELSLLMITMVDPITSMIFSSNYRIAAKNILKYGTSD